MSQSQEKVYIRLKKRQTVTAGETVTLGDIANVLALEEQQGLRELPLLRVPSGEHFIVVDALDVIAQILRVHPALHVEAVGATDTILEVKKKRYVPSYAALVAVWLLLFVGSGLAIMNFHADVSMLDVHRRLYYLLTGEQSARPLILQIPYSVGVGIGMIVFFNRLFKRRFNEEPSPLEVEMFLYQESIDQYVVQREREQGQGSESQEQGGRGI
ncbi:stage V sporulation protein AA [Numidum massiliense]|uniref:stage V sporulation protein AA n=1 Tax=Numidum massiliense TaxID=1522315 RepID=UPI000A3EC71D|nr:stage V sporulation protein AA [Numidum massiliense]